MVVAAGRSKREGRARNYPRCRPADPGYSAGTATAVAAGDGRPAASGGNVRAPTERSARACSPRPGSNLFHGRARVIFQSRATTTTRGATPRRSVERSARRAKGITRGGYELPPRKSLSLDIRRFRDGGRNERWVKRLSLGA